MPELILNPQDSQVGRRFLPPGGLLAGVEHWEVTTLLGPCVAVTLWCRRSHAAAICHAMLPSAPVGPVPAEARWKYMDKAVPEMLVRLLRSGATPSMIEAKLFGGADLLSEPDPGASYRIGGRNVQCARDILAEYGIPIVAFDVGGTIARKLVFDTATGGVRIKRLSKFRQKSA